MWSEKKDPQKGRKAKIDAMKGFLMELPPNKDCKIEQVKTMFMYNIGSSKVKTDEYFQIVTGFCTDLFVVDDEKGTVQYCPKQKKDMKKND